MEYTWNEKDIKVGRFVHRVPGNANTAYKIGFIVPRHQDQNPKQKYVLQAITDGMVGKFYTKEELAEHLTEDGFAPAHLHNVLAYMTELRSMVEGTYDD